MIIFFKKKSELCNSLGFLIKKAQFLSLHFSPIFERVWFQRYITRDLDYVPKFCPVRLKKYGINYTRHTKPTRHMLERHSNANDLCSSK